jgi:DNA-binding protein HU-beta
MAHKSLWTIAPPRICAKTGADAGPPKETQDMANQMTRAQLVAALTAVTGADKKSTGATLDALAEIVSREVAGGGAVALPGIGRIYCRERPARQVRNPSTGEMIAKPADKAVKITVAKALKDSVNG